MSIFDGFDNSRIKEPPYSGVHARIDVDVEPGHWHISTILLEICRLNCVRVAEKVVSRMVGRFYEDFVLSFPQKSTQVFIEQLTDWVSRDNIIGGIAAGCNPDIFKAEIPAMFSAPDTHHKKVEIVIGVNIYASGRIPCITFFAQPLEIRFIPMTYYP
jgi:hypothetical protein